MRPVDRGGWPTDSKGKPKQFSKYQEAKEELIARLGEYCSYCEMRVTSSLAVEHIQAKSQNTELELKWDNFLLACSNCNSTKGIKVVTLEDLSKYYWVDRDNTFRAFEYSKGGLVRVNSNLTEVEKQRAQRTLELTGVDKFPSKASDRRRINRKEAWEIAEMSLKNLQSNDTPEMRDMIVTIAKSKGFWSVWMTVFKQDSDMLKRLIDVFPGTCQACFDAQGQPIQRPGGAL